jgi:hypothetical protein
MYGICAIIYYNITIASGKQNDRVKIVRMFLPCYTVEIKKLHKGIKIDPMHFYIL